MSEQKLRLEYIDPADLAANDFNWRSHPQPQLDALRDVIAEVGWAGALLFNEQTGKLIDGHGRKELFAGKGPAHDCGRDFIVTSAIVCRVERRRVDEGVQGTWLRTYSWFSTTLRLLPRPIGTRTAYHAGTAILGNRTSRGWDVQGQATRRKCR